MGERAVQPFDLPAIELGKIGMKPNGRRRRLAQQGVQALSIGLQLVQLTLQPRCPDEDAVDVEPAAGLPSDGPLTGLVQTATELLEQPDPKVEGLIGLLKPLIRNGANPVVFCRFISTAEHVRDALRKAFQKLRIEAVTGLLTPEERRERVAGMGEDQQRILVATDCLSEGINLQKLFDTVVHYDLSWNPTRHQQREGRVDRFGQPAEEVRSILMFSPDSAIDGAVLDVILRKAEAIRKATGVTVPLPEERGPVTDALMAAMMLRRGGQREQLALDLRLDHGTASMEQRWRDVQENETKSRARFAQNAMKPQEVAPEWARARDLLGGPQEALDFVQAAMARFDAPLERKKTLYLAHVHGLDRALRERLEERGLTGSLRLATTDPVPSGAGLLTRTHPLTATLAEALVEGALDPASLPGLGLGRTGACPRRNHVRCVLSISKLSGRVWQGPEDRSKSTALLSSEVGVRAQPKCRMQSP